ncbi:hypothetical protein M8C21_022113, partial [Ambrosia artemisiifolia]
AYKARSHRRDDKRNHKQQLKLLLNIRSSIQQSLTDQTPRHHKPIQSPIADLPASLANSSPPPPVRSLRFAGNDLVSRFCVWFEFLDDRFQRFEAFIERALIVKLEDWGHFGFARARMKEFIVTEKTTEKITVGSHVWVENPSVAWIDGEMLKIDGTEAEIRTSDGQKVVTKLSNVYPKEMDCPEGGVDDMTKLSYLHEPGVLHNLAIRYERNILIAVNPFQSLPHLYDAHMMEKYKGAEFGDLSPHVFAIAEIAFREMVNEGKNNSILVSGESGAGKTETTKMLMRYLAHV